MQHQTACLPCVPCRALRSLDEARDELQGQLDAKEEALAALTAETEAAHRAADDAARSGHGMASQQIGTLHGCSGLVAVCAHMHVCCIAYA